MYLHMLQVSERCNFVFWGVVNDYVLERCDYRDMIKLPVKFRLLLIVLTAICNNGHPTYMYVMKLYLRTYL